MPRSFRFIHSFGIEFIILKTELLENRLIVWNLDDSKKLFSQGYYGKPIGIPKPKLDEINVPLILDLIGPSVNALLEQVHAAQGVVSDASSKVTH